LNRCIGERSGGGKMILEDIIENITNAGGTVTDVNATDFTASIEYIGTDGELHTDKYKIVINADGSENWVKI